MSTQMGKKMNDEELKDYFRESWLKEDRNKIGKYMSRIVQVGLEIIAKEDGCSPQLREKSTEQDYHTGEKPL